MNVPAELTAPDLAALMGIHPQTVRRRLAAGLIPGAVRVGKSWIIPLAAVQNMYPGAWDSIVARLTLMGRASDTE